MPSLAHRKPESITTISWNERTNLYEVVHRIHQHEAQALLSSQAGQYVDLASLKGRAELALLLEGVFMVFDQASEQIAITTVGALIEADYILVMQEFEKPLARRIEVFLGLHQIFNKGHISLLRVQADSNEILLKFDVKKDMQFVQLW